MLKRITWFVIKQIAINIIMFDLNMHPMQAFHLNTFYTSVYVCACIYALLIEFEIFLKQENGKNAT